SWAVVGAVTGGEVQILGTRPEDMEVVAAVLTRMQISCAFEDGVFHVRPSPELRSGGRVTTGLWPGFPSDLVSLVTVLATQCDGQPLVHDWMYELRLFALEQMSAMRADLFLCDPHRIIVTGPTRLRGRPLDSRDLRSGMALIAAALAADGQSRLAPLEAVEGGCAQAVDRLQGLAAARGRATDCRDWERRSRSYREPPGFFGGTGSSFGGSCGRGGSATGSSASGASESRPTLNGRRSASVRSRMRMMCGVNVSRMSVWSTVLVLCANSRPTTGISLKPGMPSSALRSESRIRPASMFVSPSRSRMTVLISRFPKVGRPPNPVPEMLLTDTFSVSDTSSS